MKIVFIGDSITECGRDKADPQSLGDGYVAILREKLKNLYEDVRFEFLNRGVSHDRVADVQARIQKDVADEHPDICVVLIGVNDVLRKYDAGASLDFDAVAASYEDALKQVKACGAKLIAVEPFLLDVPSKRRLRADFNTLVHIISMPMPMCRWTKCSTASARAWAWRRTPPTACIPPTALPA